MRVISALTSFLDSLEPTSLSRPYGAGAGAGAGLGAGAGAGAGASSDSTISLERFGRAATCDSDSCATCGGVNCRACSGENSPNCRRVIPPTVFRLQRSHLGRLDRVNIFCRDPLDLSWSHTRNRLRLNPTDLARAEAHQLPPAPMPPSDHSGQHPPLGVAVPRPD